MLKKIFICLAFFAHFATAQFFEEEEIACPNLLNELISYNQDLQVERQAIHSALKEVSSFLNKVSKEGQILKTELSEMIELVNTSHRALQDNDFFLFSDRGFSLENAVDTCVN